VKYFFDTSVLVAAVLAQHVHHEASLAAYLKADKHHAGCAAHSLAEVYATLTRLPGRHRVECEAALLLLDEIRKRMAVVTLDEQDYYGAISSAAMEGITGGTIYDALLAHCALKSNTATIYTWNVEHFRRLGPAVAQRVRTP
jgi:predicted nucleic acid-binding protein